MSLKLKDSSKDYDYEEKDLVSALRSIGIKRGDIVFSHVGMGMLGIPKEGLDQDIISDLIYRAFMEVLGSKGTMLVPTYTYSFCRGETFDVRNSPSTVGYFTEKFRKRPGVRRSLEPIFSVAGIGPKTEALFRDIPMACFGQDCIYERLVKAGTYICNVGVGFRYATFVHYAEQTAGVPYRFMKTFKGKIIDYEGNETETEIEYYVRNAVDDETTFPNLRRLEKDVRRKGLCRSSLVGRGEITCIRCSDLLRLCIEGIKRDPWYLAEGQKKG